MKDVAKFHRDYDRHPDDRIRLFDAVSGHVTADRVLYPGSYVDIAPSVFYDEVIYVDVDRRTPRFFAQVEPVAELVAAKRRAIGRPTEPPPIIEFHHLDYNDPLPIAERSVDLLISLYAGFISEACAAYVKPGGHLLANPSHGDVAMADLDPGYELVAVVHSRDGAYVVDDRGLDRYLIPKKGERPTAEQLHDDGRGIAYTRPAFAYLFRRAAL